MWQIILENLIPLVFAVITPVLLVFVNKVLHLAASKWKLEEALVYEDKVEDLILKGIRAAEQKSISKVHKDQPDTPGEEKLRMVLDFVNSQLVAMKLPEKAGEQLSMLVEAKLFEGAKEKPLLPPPADPAPAPVVVAPTPQV